MARYLVHCQPNGTATSVAPCADLDGVGYSPVMVLESLPGDFSIANTPDLYAWGFGMVMFPFMLGIVVGAIIRIVRSA